LHDQISLAQPIHRDWLAMDVMERSPINGAFHGQPLIDPAVNAWAGDNLRARQHTMHTPPLIAGQCVGDYYSTPSEVR